MDRIFEGADITLPEIKKVLLELASQGLNRPQIGEDFKSRSSLVHKRLTSTWKLFIDSVMQEWKIFNIISVLLSRYVNSFSSYTCSKSEPLIYFYSTIPAILQFEGAAQDPLTRFTASFSLNMRIDKFVVWMHARGTF